MHIYSWSSAARSETGNVRNINEDAYLNAPQTGLWVVADGMGGHQSGDLASQSIIAALQTFQLQPQLDSSIATIQTSLTQVSAKLIHEAQSRGTGQTIGSTVLVLLAHETTGTVLWAGDSRLYRLRDKQLHSLSKDHSYVESLIDQGLVEPEQAEDHPAAHIITRAIGISETAELEIRQFDLLPGDRYLLCSDGLYRELNPDEIAGTLRQSDCKTACEQLIQQALEREGRDNITAVVVDILLADETIEISRTTAQSNQPIENTVEPDT